MLNEMLHMRECPLCGRPHAYPLEGWWCPYCGTSLSTSMRKELRTLNDRVLILEKLLEWNQLDSLLKDETP